MLQPEVVLIASISRDPVWAPPDPPLTTPSPRLPFLRSSSVGGAARVYPHNKMNDYDNSIIEENCVHY